MGAHLDDIHVVQGTYTSSSVFVVEWRYKDLVIRGGYAAVGGPCDPSRYPTILDAQGLPGRGVIFAQGLNLPSELSGFTITGGNVDVGGGMHALTSTLQIIDCIFLSNRAGSGGGSIVIGAP